MINLLLNQIKQDVYIQNHPDKDLRYNTIPILNIKDLTIKFKRNMIIRIDEYEYYDHNSGSNDQARIMFCNTPIGLEIVLSISENGSPYLYIDSYNTEFSITKNYLNKWRIKKTQTCDV